MGKILCFLGFHQWWHYLDWGCESRSCRRCKRREHKTPYGWIRT